jgi:hypothetical protein
MRSTEESKVLERLTSGPDTVPLSHANASIQLPSDFAPPLQVRTRILRTRKIELRLRGIELSPRLIEQCSPKSIRSRSLGYHDLPRLRIAPRSSKLREREDSIYDRSRDGVRQEPAAAEASAHQLRHDREFRGVDRRRNDCLFANHVIYRRTTASNRCYLILRAGLQDLVHQYIIR